MDAELRVRMCCFFISFSIAAAAATVGVVVVGIAAAAAPLLFRLLPLPPHHPCR